MSSRLDAEAKALTVALNSISNNNASIQHIFLSYSDLLLVINTRNSHNAWRADPWISIIHNLLVAIGDPMIYLIPKGRMEATAKLATHGFSLHTISLFHQGRDLPRWIMKAFVSDSFNVC